jgi:predicted secreted hydrolase
MKQLFRQLRLPAMLCALHVFALSGAVPEYRQALPGYRYSFPRDHFEHPDFRTEWWYYTGNLADATGARYGFELVFFRQGQHHDAGSKSAWEVQDLYLAHAALTDVTGRRFLYEERLNRQGPGIAGASFAQQRIWNGNWSVAWNAEVQSLEATTGQFRFHLELKPEKPFVIHGENGVSQKAAGAGQASHYVSFTRLAVKGDLDTGGRSKTTVTGEAWMDHEWFSRQLSDDQVGWDWFSIQLDNKTELMLFELRRKDGSIDPWSAGTFVDAAGHAHALTHTGFTLEPLDREGKYPVKWRIRIPSLNIDIICRAALRNQELRPLHGGPSYWEGAMDYSGTHKGAGYLEMTGYSAPVKLP